MGLTPSQNQTTAELEAPSKRSLLLSLHNLPLCSFIDCLIDGNLSVLGEGSPEELQAHWEQLYAAFCDAIATGGSKAKISTDANIKYYELKIAAIQAAVDFLTIRYSAEICEELKKEGFTYEFTEETLLDDLAKVVEESKRWVRDRDQLLRHKETTQGDNTNIDRGYFDSILNSISAMVKYDVNDNITTSRFCRYYTALIAHIEKSSNNGR